MSVRKLPHKPDEPGDKPAAAPEHAAPGHDAGMPAEPPVLPRGLAPRLARAFRAPRARRAALIPYLTGGHPDPETSDRLVATLIDAGADIVELGVPFSDPIADGPVVQQSTHAALTAGVTPDDVLGLAAAHSAGAPFVLLTYLNSVLAYGPRAFFERAATVGVEALVIPDLPLDEAAGRDVSLARADGGLALLAAGAGVSLVPMATPTSTDDRLDLVAAAATSFVYCVAVTGVTGARAEVGAELPRLLARLRERTDAPLAVGFGISTPEQAANVATLADGVIIGSALIDAVTRAATPDDACTAARALVSAASAAIAGRLKQRRPRTGTGSPIGLPLSRGQAGQAARAQSPSSPRRKSPGRPPTTRRVISGRSRQTTRSKAPRARTLWPTRAWSAKRPRNETTSPRSATGGPSRNRSSRSP